MTASTAERTPEVLPALRGSSGTVHSIGIAGLKVARAPDLIRTVLGSCVGIALFDRVAKLGGQAHVILPDSMEGSGDPGKFADTAVDLLLAQLIEQGAEKQRVAAKIGGGAAMFANNLSAANLGARNADAVRARLRHYAIRLVGQEIGGTKGRKMLLEPASGAVQVEIIGEPARTI